MYRPSGTADESPGNEADAALRQGLYRLPVPDVGSDFDARIHAALRRPTPWRRLLWMQARPVLSTAACSLVVTLALLKGGGRPERLVQSTESGALITAGAWERIDALDSSDLSAAPLRGFATLHRPLTAKEIPPKASQKAPASKTRS